MDPSSQGLLTRLRALGAWALRLELRLAPTEPQRLFALTIVIGLVCGLTAVIFHHAIAVGEHLLFNRAASAPGQLWMLWVVVTPTLGGLAPAPRTTSSAT
jgi:hypothetical protein